MDMRALIIDDDEKLQALLREYLEGYGYEIISLTDGTEAVEQISKHNPDIVILDIMMPRRDGTEVLRDIRAELDVPVIMLTARGEESDRIVGLELGADDYLSKPFNPRELLARIKAVLRRSNTGDKQAELEQPADRVEAGGFTLSLSMQILSYGDKKVELSTTEYRILETMMRRPNRVLSRDEIMNLARGRDFLAFDRSIDVHISKLRTKLESVSGMRECIKTVWGSGYMFVVT